MNAAADEVVRRALELDDQERAEVVAHLLDSLEERSAPDAEAAWEADLERRATELETGVVEGVPWEALRDRLMRGRRGS